jgi:hypothetical protein
MIDPGWSQDEVLDHRHGVSQGFSGKAVHTSMFRAWCKLDARVVTGVVATLYLHAAVNLLHCKSSIRCCCCVVAFVLNFRVRLVN